MLKKLLIIDDEENMLHMLNALLSKAGYDITTALGGQEALAIIEKERFDFVLCDVKMPGLSGLEVLQQMHQLEHFPTVIMMSAYGNFDTAITAMKSGAYDFISKPFKKDEVLLALKKAEEREQLREENVALKEKIAEVTFSKGFESLIRKAPIMEQQIELARKVAEYQTTVLITGASGTGKELLAKGIHANSQRKHCKFYAINCASIPSELIESELFGYIKGAFTGAESDRKGIFEAADKSTLFLDEIGDLPQAVQVKLLRVLQENEIKPVGSHVTKKIDVRILAATSRNLEEEVRNHTFREDLFYRLNVVNIRLPTLVERKEDIPLLCDHFIEKLSRKMGKNVTGMSSGALRLIFEYGWPGNVRELENVIERALVLVEGDRIVGSNLPEHLFVAADHEERCKQFMEMSGSLKSAQKELEAQMISSALQRSGGNKSAAAKELEISYPSLLNKIKEYNIG